MFNIIQAGEPLNINTINILIYGEPGSGKTSLANTAANPLTLDFDKGVHRSEFRQNVMVIESWEQINNNMAELLKLFNNYSTIILDTVDTLLDYMGGWIVDRDPRLARNKLQYYGKLKEEFSQFIGRLRTLNKNVILIAHVKEKDEGDYRIKRPSITGGSYDRVLQISDVAGYMYIKGRSRMLDFNPSEYWVGKNCANLPELAIPDFKANPEFFQGIINNILSNINTATELQARTITLINEYELQLNSIENLDEMNKFIEALSKEDKALKIQLWPKIQEYAGNIGLEFDKKKKIFIEAGV